MVGGNDSGGEGSIDRHAPKVLETVTVETAFLDSELRIWDTNTPRIPMDRRAKYAFYSKMKGFVPVEVTVDSAFSNPAHYGAGGFEGIRLVRTPYGDGFVELAHNLARFIYSSLAFDPTLQIAVLNILNEPDVSHVIHSQRTPKEFYDDAAKTLERGGDIVLKIDVIHKDGRDDKREIPVKLKAKFGSQTTEFSLKELQAAVCSLAFLNDLVRYDPYPNSVVQVDGGYFRPVFWVSGEEGLKVPTVIESENGELISKPLYFAIGTLPWKQYLSEKHYSEGLDILLAPLPRIDEALPFKQKIASNYVNSAMNVNIAKLLGYGEILAMNHHNEIVEGSAENIIVLFTHKRTGRMHAYFPPLSSNILPGTTRNRMLRIMEEGLALNGKKVKLMVKAPTREQLMSGLRETADWEVSAIVLMGTGVGLIHARSLTVNDMLKRLMRIDQLRSEEESDEAFPIERPESNQSKYLINKGKKHPFVDLLQQEYNRFILSDNGSRICRPFDVHPDALEFIFGMGLGELEGGREFRKKLEDGYFREKINGIQQPDELTKRYKEFVLPLRKMNEVSIMRRTSRR